MNPKVDFYFNKAGKWQQETERLRTIILDCGLTEELKWGCPCYTFQNRNIVLIHDFKEYCALLLFKGALLNDPHHILVQQSKNVQAARQIRFTNVLEIIELEPAIKACVFEAIEVEKAGLKVNLKKTEEFTMPQEFQYKLDKIPALKTAFEALTPGRQRAYLLHFSSPKQSKTRESRIEKYIPQILDGKGLND
ncbi:YdeI/OmpD-associated family protein [Mucilaginibacter aquaedulcis]|uniref:YdeI/OmpD-associated family protein n=1 Tax=Mucilaginibacter aquaedulcis TaxID=1187081 RepID=UPI0025B50180|nr:YdeI family protein [Mucilaginibacter aquaedulcis]MDN3547252.1 YdeI family protein [Mucilaginibacter aquaedulcis]